MRTLLAQRSPVRIQPVSELDQVQRSAKFVEFDFFFLLLIGTE